MSELSPQSNTHQAILDLLDGMRQSVIGQTDVTEALILALLSDGNLLLEGLPGTAKTRAIRTLAQLLGVSLGRIQFTPDLLPSDITGTEVYQSDHGASRMVFQPGPLFHELVLADEINRAPAKVQSALLEAMAERQITVAGNTHHLPPLFMVMATQNPLEQEGTYPLPEAQLDRFTLKVQMPYPDAEAELAIIRLLQQEESGQPASLPTIDTAHIFAARQAIARLPVSQSIDQYIVDLVLATRHPQGQLAQQIAIGASPRGSIALHRVSRAHAWLQGKDYVDPDDVRAVIHLVLRHRLVLRYEAIAEQITADAVIDSLIQQVAVA